MGRWERMAVMAGAVRGVLRQPGAMTLSACVAAAVAAAVVSVSCQVRPQARTLVPEFQYPVAAEPVIRVRIGQGLTRAEVSGPGAILVQGEGGPPEVLKAPLVIRAEGGSWTVADADGAERNCPPGGSVHLSPGGAGEPGEAATLRVVGTEYAGGLEVRFPRGGGASFDLINELPLEDYLPGVLARELYEGWPLETYRAQAVAARSYALHEIARGRARGASFDIEGSPVDQAYAGAAGRRVAEEAVRSTRGQALTWHGEVVRAYYSSTCGGRTASAAEHWPTAKGFEFNLARPIQAHKREHACGDSPAYRWRVERSVWDVSERLRAWGWAGGSAARALGRVAAISPARHNSAGRPTRYTVRDADGRKASLSAEQLRLALNYPAPGHPAPGRAQSAKSGDVQVEVSGTRVVISGRGFGHGVGLCQYCARAMALRGDTYRAMLDRFYPAARIERVY